MRFLRLCSTAIIAAVAVTGAMLLGLGLLAQLRRFRLYHGEGVGFHDPGCGVSFCDSSVFWLAGRLARQGGIETLYHGGAFAAFGGAVLPGHLDHLPFVYPPVTLLPAAVLAAAPLAVGYVVFSVLTIVAAVALLRRAGVGWACIGFGLVSPAAMLSIYLGQFGLICGALLIGGLAQLERRPAEAGVLLGLLCIKPPYAVAAPLVVLAGRHWRVMAAGVVTFGLLVGFSLAWFGLAAWADFLGPARAAARFLLVTPFAYGNTVRGVSVFWMLRSLGASVGVSGGVQAVVSVGALGGIAWLWRGPVADPAARLLATLCLVLLASPYAYADDMAGVSVALAMGWRREAPVRNAVLAIVWLSPALTGRFLHDLGFLPEPVFIVAALGVTVSRIGLRKEASTSFCEQKEAKKLF